MLHALEYSHLYHHNTMLQLKLSSMQLLQFLSSVQLQNRHDCTATHSDDSKWNGRKQSTCKSWRERFTSSIASATTSSCACDRVNTMSWDANKSSAQSLECKGVHLSANLQRLKNKIVGLKKVESVSNIHRVMARGTGEISAQAKCTLCAFDAGRSWRSALVLRIN